MEIRLLRDELPPEPLTLFERWYDEAEALPEREAMTLASLGEDGLPDARTVLLRGLERTPGHEGFVFYTNYASAKGRGLALYPACALLFYWGDLMGGSTFGGRQVRVRGVAERLPPAVSDVYFAGRPRLSQLGAWASPQSEPIDEHTLDTRLVAVEREFAGREVPRPPHWGGYLVVIASIELWQGRAGRLHDRFLYTRSGVGGWASQRLAP